MSLARLLGAVALGLLTLVCSAGAVSMGLPSLTPDTSVLPLYGFRVDFGMLQVLQMRSLRSNRPGDLWGPYLAITYGCSAKRRARR